MNLRQEVTNEYKELMNLYKARKESVQTRKDLELKIAADNGDLTKRLKSLIEPIAKKAGIRLLLTIEDHRVTISKNETILGKHQSHRVNIVYGLEPIENWFESAASLRKAIRHIEKLVRCYKVFYNKYSDRPFVPVFNNLVTVSIETRNRYF